MKRSYPQNQADLDPHRHVSTAGSKATNIGYGLGSETNGSTLTSQAFTATAGTALQFSFNFVTSDGAGFSDYGFAHLLDATTGNTVAVLFNARTKPSGTIAPGGGLPAPVATLTPSSVPIVSGPPSWAPLGASSGSCYSAGCGFTGWVKSAYDIVAAGAYKLQFGVTNWLDKSYDTGMAFDGVTVGGVSIGGGGSAVPEIDPSSVASGLTLLLGGLAILRGRRTAIRGRALG